MGLLTAAKIKHFFNSKNYLREKNKVINTVNNNARTEYLQFDETEMWDYTLLPDHGHPESAYKFNPIAFIDFSDSGCFKNRFVVKSCDPYIWPDSVSNVYTLEHYGINGVDTGSKRFYKYAPDFNYDKFEDIFVGKESNFDMDGSSALTLSAVVGNSEVFDYPVWKENGECYGFDGGFFQGFFKTESCKYQILPDALGGEDWNFEFVIKPHDFDYNHRTTLNDAHPENKGIFFYIGTRAENKWYKYFKRTKDEESGIVEDRFDVSVPVWKTLESYDEQLAMLGRDAHILSNYLSSVPYDICSYKGKTMKEISDEYSLGIFEGKTSIVTDNKHIFYDRTPEGDKASINKYSGTYIVYPEVHEFPENGHTYFDRTPSGMIASKYIAQVQQYGMSSKQKYSIVEDLIGNAFALQVRDDGAIGYKYLVRDCEGDLPYKIDSGFSKPGMVKKDEWSQIFVKMISISATKMRVFIYVNGFLKYVSHEMDKINLRKLDTDYSKQQGVPYCISLGGGTQGLCDVIYNDPEALPSKILPLEKNFGGTFEGYMKSFKYWLGVIGVVKRTITQKTIKH